MDKLPSTRQFSDLQRRSRDREGQAANRYVACPLDLNDRFDDGREYFGLAHILCGQRPIDNRARRAVEAPLSGLGHSLPDVPDDVLLDAERARRMPASTITNRMLLLIENFKAHEFLALQEFE